MTDAPAPRRRTGRIVTVTVIAVVVLAGLVVAAELIARSVVAGTVRSLVVQHVGLSSDEAVDVDVAGVVLPQLITGRLDDVTVSANDVELGPLTGDVRVEMRGVPVSGNAAADGGTASVRLNEDQLRQLLSQLPDFPSGTVTMNAPDLAFTTDLSLFSVRIPVGVSVTPGAASGEVTLTPSAFDLGGNRVDADALRDQFGGVATGLLQTRSVCIADRLPAGLILTSAEVEDQQLVATFDVAGGVISDPALQAKGSCG